jgi:hypothetical protein
MNISDEVLKQLIDPNAMCKFPPIFGVKEVQEKFNITFSRIEEYFSKIKKIMNIKDSFKLIREEYYGKKFIKIVFIPSSLNTETEGKRFLILQILKVFTTLGFSYRFYVKNFLDYTKVYSLEEQRYSDIDYYYYNYEQYSIFNYNFEDNNVRKNGNYTGFLKNPETEKRRPSIYSINSLEKRQSIEEIEALFDFTKFASRRLMEVECSAGISACFFLKNIFEEDLYHLIHINNLILNKL